MTANLSQRIKVLHSNLSFGLVCFETRKVILSRCIVEKHKDSWVVSSICEVSIKLYLMCKLPEGFVCYCLTNKIVSLVPQTNANMLFIVNIRSLICRHVAWFRATCCVNDAQFAMLNFDNRKSMHYTWCLAEKQDKSDST